MKTFLFLASVLFGVLARPDGLLHEHAGRVSVTQSSIGTYKYAVHLKDSSRTEERLEDGTVTGEYTITDAHGVPQVIRYVAGKDGFKLLEAATSSAAPEADVEATVMPEEEVSDSGSNLVVPVEAVSVVFSPVPSEHVKSVDTTHELPPAPPVPVEDTLEVKAAKKEFFATYNAALASATT